MKLTGSESRESCESQYPGTVSVRRACSSLSGRDADELGGTKDSTTATEIDIAIDARERIPAIVGSKTIAWTKRQDRSVSLRGAFPQRGQQVLDGCDHGWYGLLIQFPEVLDGQIGNALPGTSENEEPHVLRGGMVGGGVHAEHLELALKLE